jgi:hypothetical protein
VQIQVAKIITMNNITQQQAENMVYEHLKMEYSDAVIKSMPYRVTISDNNVISQAIDGTWRDVYKVEMVPQLFLIGH